MKEQKHVVAARRQRPLLERVITKLSGNCVSVHPAISKILFYPNIDVRQGFVLFFNR